MAQSLCECAFECCSQESRVKNVKAWRHLQDTGVYLPCFSDGECKTSDKKACPELVSDQAFINSYSFSSQVRIGCLLSQPLSPQLPQLPYFVERISLKKHQPSPQAFCLEHSYRTKLSSARVEEEGVM